MCYDSTGCDYRPLSECDTGEDGGIGADPDIILDEDRGIMVEAVKLWIKVMVDRRQDYIMPDQHSIPDGNSSLVLEVSA